MVTNWHVPPLQWKPGLPGLTISRVIIVTGSLILPVVSQLVAPLWILSQLSDGLLHPRLPKDISSHSHQGFDMNEENDFSAHRHDHNVMTYIILQAWCEASWKEMCKRDKRSEDGWKMKAAKKRNWTTPCCRHDKEQAALYREND